MQRLLLLGLNHTTAPLELRERLAFSAQDRDAALAALKSKFVECEAVLLSTCNRVELYLSRQTHGHPRREELAAFLAEMRGMKPGEFESHLYEKTEKEMVRHLFSVASSLNSMVLGETQIMGQVREAYEAAREAGTAGSMLNPLFQRAVAVAREVMKETALGEGRASVAGMAVEYARQIFDVFSDKTVLNIGAGKMASLVLANMSSLKPGRLLVCNRDPAKAQQLAGRFGGSVVPMSDLTEHLSAADIVVSSTGSPEPIISRAMMEGVMRRRRYKPVFVIDIAVPRDVAAEAGSIENVYLYNLDDLQHAAAATREKRGEAVEAAEKIVERNVGEFVLWHRTRMMGPMIDRLYKRSHSLALEELTRTLGKLNGITPEDKSQLEELARRIVNKLLHDPIQMLRETDSPHGPNAAYLHALDKLFKLDEVDEESGA